MENWFVLSDAWLRWLIGSIGGCYVAIAGVYVLLSNKIEAIKTNHLKHVNTRLSNLEDAVGMSHGTELDSEDEPNGSNE